MLVPHALCKWKERHMVHFEIPMHATGGYAPVLQPPLPYSHAMQPSDGGTWHVPCVSETSPQGWMRVW